MRTRVCIDKSVDDRRYGDVALKVLPESFVNDPDRLARFQREAHVLASLNHPNIAAIYGVEESSGVRALVMELVEGRLRERRGIRRTKVRPYGRRAHHARDDANRRAARHGLHI